MEAEMDRASQISEIVRADSAQEAVNGESFGSGVPGDLVGYEQAAAILGVPVGTLYAWVHYRRVPHVRLGRRLVKFSRVGLGRWLADRAVAVEVQS